jgi:hypothetical protein
MDCSLILKGGISTIRDEAHCVFSLSPRQHAPCIFAVLTGLIRTEELASQTTIHCSDGKLIESAMRSLAARKPEAFKVLLLLHPEANAIAPSALGRYRKASRSQYSSNLSARALSTIRPVPVPRKALSRLNKKLTHVLHLHAIRGH